MRAQLNQGKLNEYSPTTIICVGTCTGFATFEIVCQIPENFENEFWMYEGEVVNDEIVKLNKIK